MKKGFASDNNSGVHPKVFERMEAANTGHVVGIRLLRKQLIFSGINLEKMPKYFLFSTGPVQMFWAFQPLRKVLIQ